MKRNFKILSWGGVGDSLLSTPTFKSLKEKYPDSTISVLCITQAHYDIFKYNPYIDSLRKVPEWITKLNQIWQFVIFKFLNREWINYGALRPSLYYKKSAAKIVGEMMNVEVENTKPLIFLTPNEEMKARKMIEPFNNPVAINPTSRTTKNQEWEIEYWKDLIKRMPDVTFIQLGLKDEEYIEGAVDFRGKVSLRMSVALLKQMKGFVGVETFLGHASAAVEVPAVILFGPSNPEIWGYSENVNLYKSNPCSPCVDYLGNNLCPYQKPCMKMITVAEVEKAIRKGILKQENNVWETANQKIVKISVIENN